MSKEIEKIKTIIAIAVFLAMCYLIGKLTVRGIFITYELQYLRPLMIVAISIAGLSILFALKKLL